MADQAFDGIALAIAKQSAFGTVNATIKALSGALVVGEGEAGRLGSAGCVGFKPG